MPADPVVYSAENFEPRPDQELVCTVSRGVFRDPVEWPSHHVFCSICIPGMPPIGTLRRREMSVSQLASAVPLVANMIAWLTMRCPRGDECCSSNCHLDSSESRNALCPDRGAQKRLLELSWPPSVRCPKRTVRCSRGFSLGADQLRDHDCVQELRCFIT
ncbi:hypothetical protein HPB49_017303 [Dermacentor silvarum]|uniref:Uncharacterized protein n=1 Tax=Dermacentor silvarum TaxID=543639 RepID=A0ACB8E241_DERSI|nr:E3 ubiquitin-protein ligase NRDP1 [Dermacentor silvarum]KAH7980585.1 hypothetical protein HPB49_017303 [Dermacentor silvarum]